MGVCGLSWSSLEGFSHYICIVRQAKTDGHGNFRLYSLHGPGTINSQEIDIDSRSFRCFGVAVPTEERLGVDGFSWVSKMRSMGEVKVAF